jgi:hypothetical protein
MHTRQIRNTRLYGAQVNGHLTNNGAVFESLYHDSEFQTSYGTPLSWDNFVQACAEFSGE